jgi:hypothetical protein
LQSLIVGAIIFIFSKTDIISYYNTNIDYQLQEVQAMHANELKQKLRNLKKLELRLRYGITFDYGKENASLIDKQKLSLIWNEFFNLSESSNHNARYSLRMLMKMTDDEFKQALDAYWFRLYYCIYQEKGFGRKDLQEPELLNYLGLPLDADNNLVRRRFYELCKIYHPDAGGDKDKFIELMNVMERYGNKH